MLFNKGLSRSDSRHSFNIRLLLVLPLLSLLTSCTTFIPGLDRILFSNSSAKVGPLVKTDEQYPAVVNESVLATQDSATIAETIADTSELKSKTDANIETKIKISNSKTTAKPDHIDPQPPTAKVTPLKARKTAPKAADVTIEKESNDIVIAYGSVSGKVVLVGDDGQQLSANDTLITLTPKTKRNEVQNRPSKVHLIDMENKEYQPRYSGVQAGDQVVFVNKDNILHNVFSSSGNNAFDLGTYGAGLKRAVTLQEPGVVKIYCNIHSDMATFISVSDQGFSVKADDQGRYQIDEVLPGAYELAIWNIRGEKKQVVNVTADNTIKLMDRIDTTAFKVEPHKNKFGGKYSKNSTLFEDEFY